MGRWDFRFLKLMRGKRVRENKLVGGPLRGPHAEIDFRVRRGPLAKFDFSRVGPLKHPHAKMMGRFLQTRPIMVRLQSKELIAQENQFLVVA